MKENMKAEAAALIAEMRKRSVTGTGIMLNAGGNGLLVAAFDAMQAELDLITNEAVIAGWELSAEGFNNEVCQISSMELVKMLSDTAKKVQPDLDADKWISVKDRLPEYDTNDNWEYLVYDTLNNKVNHDYWICPSDGGQPFWNHYGSHVTHWQPLPKPPMQHINKLWAVNIPEEPESEELLFAAVSKEHAQSIVSRLHNELFEMYPTFGEPIEDSIYVTEWQDSSEEHAESLATKWWEHTTFLGCE